MKKQQLMENELQILANQGDRVLDEKINAVEQLIPPIVPSATTASISNLTDNSDFSWSTDAYTNAGITPATAGDPNNRAYNWYRMQRATALLVEDDAHSLKGPLHSLYAAETTDTPRWNKINGWGELGSVGATPWDICCPLPNNFVTPGMRFYIQMLARLRTDSPLAATLRFFWEMWDNTNSAPLPAVIQGSAFTLDAATFGAIGATSRAYRLIVDTDNGDQIESITATVTDAPAALTPTNGVSLSWPNYGGFTQVSIYVLVGGNAFLVGIVGDGATAFLDTGQTLRSVPALPSASGTKPQAYAEINFPVSLNWAEYDFNLVVPQTYNFGLTTGKQWLRGGIIGLTGEGHQVEIDRIGVSTGWGLWSISANDKNAKSLPSTTQTGSTQGAPDGSGGPPDPDGGGGPRCSTRETLFQICDKDSKDMGQTQAKHVTEGMYLKGLNGKANRITHLRPAWSDSIVTIATENGARRRCSPSDRWLIEDGDPNGTPARELCEGIRVLTRKNGSVQGSEIALYSVSIKGEEVVSISTTGDHIYFAGDAAAHNVKPAEDQI